MKKFTAIVLLSIVASPVFAAGEGFYVGARWEMASWE